MGIRQWFTPPDREFFDLLEQQAATVTEAAHQLVGLTKDFTQVKGDDLTHAIFERLNRSLHPPLDRTEISLLTSSLDEVLDYIDGSVEKMVYYGIKSPDTYIIELAKVIHLSAVEIEGAVKAIRSIENPNFIRERCIEINRLENLADDILAEAITNLFCLQDPMTVIKLKDIYEWLEIATDECEDVADVLSDIAFRHSAS
jgi:uncharacterized protein Yka (UPF0111/DUF47 family)